MVCGSNLHYIHLFFWRLCASISTYLPKVPSYQVLLVSICLLVFKLPFHLCITYTLCLDEYILVLNLTISWSDFILNLQSSISARERWTRRYCTDLGQKPQMCLNRHASVDTYLDEEYMISVAHIYLFPQCPCLDCLLSTSHPYGPSLRFSPHYRREIRNYTYPCSHLYIAPVLNLLIRRIYIRFARQKSERSQCFLEAIANSNLLPREFCALNSLMFQAELKLRTKLPLISQAAPLTSVPLALPVAVDDPNSYTNCFIMK